MKGRGRLVQSLFIIYQIPKKRKRRKLNQSKRAQTHEKDRKNRFTSTFSSCCLLACYADFYTRTLSVSHPCARTACVDVDVSRRSNNTLFFSFSFLFFPLLLFSLHSPRFPAPHPVRSFPLSLYIIYANHDSSPGLPRRRLLLVLYHHPTSTKPSFFFIYL